MTDVWLGWTNEPNHRRGHQRALPARRWTRSPSTRASSPRGSGSSRSSWPRTRRRPARRSASSTPRSSASSTCASSELARPWRTWRDRRGSLRGSRSAGRGSVRRTRPRALAGTHAQPESPSISRTNRPEAHTLMPVEVLLAAVHPPVLRISVRTWRRPASISTSSIGSRLRNLSCQGRPRRRRARASRRGTTVQTSSLHAVW